MLREEVKTHWDIIKKEIIIPAINYLKERNPIKPFLKKGDTWKLVKKAEKGIFILERNNKTFEIPKCSEIYEDYIFSIAPNHPQSKDVPPERIKSCDFYRIEDGESVNIDGFKINFIVNCSLVIEIEKIEAGKTLVEVLPNKKGILSYCFGEVIEGKKEFKRVNALCFYSEKDSWRETIFFYSKTEQPNNLYAIKTTVPSCGESLDQLAPNDAFRLDVSEKYPDKLSSSDRIIAEREGVKQASKQKTFLFKKEFWVRKI